jgi:LPXTG-motif cell wall-anchored protein
MDHVTIIRIVAGALFVLGLGFLVQRRRKSVR